MKFEDDEFRPGASRRDDPDTSHEAAESVNVTPLELEVWQALVIHGDMTTEEIAEKTELPLQTVTPRLVPLEESGRVVRTEQRRKGRSGRGRIVWHAITYSPPPEPVAPAPAPTQPLPQPLSHGLTQTIQPALM